MRKDMAKVIVERPRRGGGPSKYGREPQRYRDDPEAAPTKVSMKPRYGNPKELNENLSPLYRYLVKNIGRPWNKVRSEIAQHVRLTNATQAHILQHVQSYVEEHAVLVDGIPYVYGRGGLHSVASPWYHRTVVLYVHPRTGLLLCAKPPRLKAEKPIEVKRLDANTCAVNVKGCWHEAKMQSIFTFDGEYLNNHFNDAVLGQLYGVGKLEAFYGKSKGKVQYAKTLRPMTRQEIRRLP